MFKRAVGQLEETPELAAFSSEARNRWLLPGWESRRIRPDEPIPAEQAYRWSWAQALRPLMVYEGPSPLWVYPWDPTETALRELAQVEAGEAEVTVQYNNPSWRPSASIARRSPHSNRSGALAPPLHAR
jgi:gentisate 1,2-dioxygenase